MAAEFSTVKDPNGSLLSSFSSYGDLEVCLNFGWLECVIYS